MMRKLMPFTLTVALSGLLLHQRSLLVRERALLAQERLRHQAMETAIAARNAAPEPSHAAPAPTSIETLSPSSYFALTARLGREVRDVPSLDLEIEPGPHRPATKPAEILPHLGPLSPRDIQRVLDL